jgi:hypothetical protein
MLTTPVVSSPPSNLFHRSLDALFPNTYRLSSTLFFFALFSSIRSAKILKKVTLIPARNSILCSHFLVPGRLTPVTRPRSLFSILFSLPTFSFFLRSAERMLLSHT